MNHDASYIYGPSLPRTYFVSINLKKSFPSAAHTTAAHTTAAHTTAAHKLSLKYNSKIIKKIKKI